MTQYLQKIFLLFFFSLITSLSFGQKKMYLSINQYLGGESFSMGQTGTNDLGTKFSISRMDYFISSIILHHDGGASTKVPDKYIFVTKGEKVKELLGSFNIAVLDSITFSIGVDSIDNHADPTLWPANHPLAPRSPDMHWGWAAGYRFVAMEGKTGSALEYDYEIHALGDQLYHPTTLVTKGKEQNGNIEIEIDANYEQALKGIFMDRNLFIHGSNKEAVYLMINFNDNVFKATQNTSSIMEVGFDVLKVYPNPVSNGKCTIALTEDQTINARYIIRDITGKVVFEELKPSLINEISLNRAGWYSIELIQSGQPVSYGKLIIQ